VKNSDFSTKDPWSRSWGAKRGSLRREKRCRGPGEQWASSNPRRINKYMGMGQNPIPLVNIKIAGKWMFIPLKMVCIGIDP